jgi:O-acetylserine/cysteine efflux transporter
MTFLSRRDLILAMAVVAIWGAHFAVIKIGVAIVSPMILLSLRFAITGLVFLPFAKMPDMRTFKKMAEIGILMGVMHQALLFTGIKLLDSASVSVLMQSQTVFAVLLGWMLLGEKFAWRTTLGLLISGLGLVVMLGVPDVQSSPKGFWIIILSALVLGYSYIRMRQLSVVHPATFACVINLVSAPLAFAVSLIMGEGTEWTNLPDIDWTGLGLVLAYQAGIVSFSHIWWQQLLSRNEVAKVTCFNLLTPPIAIAIAVAFLGTTLNAALVWGTLLTLIGVGVVVIRRVQKHRNDPVTLVE